MFVSGKRLCSIPGRAFSTFKSNIPASIWELEKRKIYQNKQHPLATIVSEIVNCLNRPEGISDVALPEGKKFELFSDFSPIVKTQDCFDALRIPADHVSRGMSDTYYLEEDTILRTHTSVH
jgi:phenylalanyl-tRNA synthetase alpha chain